MTGTTMITSNPLDGERIAGTVGFPLADIEARIADDDGKALPTGAVGVLEVRGPHAFRGDWRPPEKTAEEFRQDVCFITGDVPSSDECGYIHSIRRQQHKQTGRKGRE